MSHRRSTRTHRGRVQESWVPESATRRAVVAAAVAVAVAVPVPALDLAAVQALRLATLQ